MGSRSLVESLESRRLLATQTLGADGLLTIILNPTPDRVRVLRHPGTTKVDIIVKKEAFQQYDGVTALHIEGRGGGDRMYLGPGLDIPATIIGGPGRDYLGGGLGDDVLDGGVGNDYIVGSAGNDRLTGGVHHDIIEGGDGNDQIDGGPGRDRIAGGGGDDAITAGCSADSVDGGEGNDRINGGGGRDVLAGAAGSDVFSQSDRDREITDFATDDLRTGA